MVAVAFVNIPSGTIPPLTVYPPVGILSMAAVLKNAGHRAQFVDADVLGLSPDQVPPAITIRPDIVGIGLNVSQVSSAKAYLGALRTAFPGACLVAGGPYVSGVRQQVLEQLPQLDFAVVGEGEPAIVDLARHLSGELAVSSVRNLIRREDQQPVCNSAERIADLDALPLPDYSLVEGFIDKYSAPYPSIQSPSLAIMCTRGCPYGCAFCSSPVTWGRRLTLRSVDSVIAEVLSLKERFGVREIFFQDDTLNARPKWFFELTDAIIRNDLHKEIFFRAPFRVNQAILTDDVLRRAREANFWLIFYGVENGNQAMLNRMGKQVTAAEIERAFELTHRHGICTYASFMVGNEGETKETFQDSLALARRIRPDFGGFAAAIPFPGSRLERYARASGHILQPDFLSYRWGTPIMRTETFSAEELIEMAGQGCRLLSEITTEDWLSKNAHFKQYLATGPHAATVQRQARRYWRRHPAQAVLKAASKLMRKFSRTA